jgi:transmembrane sensor
VLLAVDIVIVSGSLGLVFFAVERAAVRWSAAPSVDVRAESAIARSVHFADGSLAELSEERAGVQVEEDGPHRVVTSVTGSARFRVVPNPARSFEVKSGDVRVRVLGTTFSVREQAGRTAKVAVEHGRVQVEWPGGSTTLESGQSGLFPPPKSVVAQPRPDEATPSPPPRASADSPVSSAKPSPIGGATQTWRDYAMQGDYSRAYIELIERGKDGVRDDPADLMLAADVARRSSHPADAVAPLRKLCDRHPGDKRAPVAAFTLGRVLLDDLGRASEAVNFFEKARTLWPAGPMAEDALAREAEACKRAGNIQRAQVLAAQYLSQYPQGVYAGPMHRMLAR